MNSSLETLASQAVGARTYDLCAIYLNRGTILVISICSGFMIVFYFGQGVVSYLSREPEVVTATQSYLLVYIVAYLMYGLDDLNRKYINSFSYNFVPMICFTMAITLHPVWTYILS
jgi:Na+-driven multidrug efflux pump